MAAQQLVTLAPAVGAARGGLRAGDVARCTYVLLLVLLVLLVLLMPLVLLVLTLLS